MLELLDDNQTLTSLNCHINKVSVTPHLSNVDVFFEVVPLQKKVLWVSYKLLDDHYLGLKASLFTLNCLQEQTAAVAKKDRR